MVYIFFTPCISLLPNQVASSILSGWKEEKTLICLACASKCQAHWGERSPWWESHEKRDNSQLRLHLTITGGVLKYSFSQPHCAPFRSVSLEVRNRNYYYYYSFYSSPGDSDVSLRSMTIALREIGREKHFICLKKELPQSWGERGLCFPEKQGIWLCSWQHPREGWLYAAPSREVRPDGP